MSYGGELQHYVVYFSLCVGSPLLLTGFLLDVYYRTFVFEKGGQRRLTCSLQSVP